MTGHLAIYTYLHLIHMKRHFQDSCKISSDNSTLIWWVRGQNSLRFFLFYVSLSLALVGVSNAIKGKVPKGGQALLRKQDQFHTSPRIHHLT